MQNTGESKQTAATSHKTILYVAGLCVAAIVLIALQYTLTSDARTDDLIEADLSEIEDLTDEFIRENKRVPELSELSLAEDVEQRAGEYNYEITNEGTEQVRLSTRYNYELCAEFMTDTAPESSRSSYSYSDYSFNQHDEGRYCFERDALAR